MAHTKEDIFNIFAERMTEESLLLFGILVDLDEPIFKEELWRAANLAKEPSDPKKEKFINSRYSLDTNIARLEGAGLVNVKAYGRIRTYTVSQLGFEFIEHYKKYN